MAREEGGAKIQTGTTNRRVDKVHYKVKATMRIIIVLSEDEAFTMFDMVRRVQNILKEGKLSLNSLSKEKAKEILKEAEKLTGIQLSEKIQNQLDKFLKLMADERVPVDELAYEFNCALSPMLQFDLFDPDT